MTATPVDGPRTGPGLHDPRAGWYAVAFAVLLLASEGALTLPDETADGATVAAFYADHRAVIVALQVAGLAAAAALGAFAWRLRRVDRAVAATGIALAVVAALPGLVTAVLALTADPADPESAARLNGWLPRTDDVLFLGVLAFALAILRRLGRDHRWLGAVAAVTAFACLGRLALEAAGQPRGALESIAPLSFLLLVACLAVLSFRPAERK